MVLKKGWIVITHGGDIITEEDTHWDALDKTLIKELRLKWYDRLWTISGKNPDEYVQFKSATQAMGQQTPTILSRCIGYKEGKDSVVLIRVNELNGNSRWEVKDTQQQRA